MSNKVFDFDLMADEMIPQDLDEGEFVEKRENNDRRSGEDRRKSVRLELDRRLGQDRRKDSKDIWKDNFLE